MAEDASNPRGAVPAADESTWSLQQNSDLTSTNWVAPTNTVANDGTNNSIIAEPSLGKLFFRLKH